MPIEYPIVQTGCDILSADSDTTIETLKRQVQAFCEAREWDQYHDARELAISVVLESAELLELFRFKSPEEVRAMLTMPDNREQVCDELADVLFSLLRFAQLYHIDLSAEFGRKMRKNELKYPVELSRGSNKKYTDLG